MKLTHPHLHPLPPEGEEILPSPALCGRVGVKAKKFITPRSSVENYRKERSFSPSLSPAAGGEDKGEGAKGDLWRCA
jgi:hypothetical protein